jgi:cell shape-determining protein MreC
MRSRREHNRRSRQYTLYVIGAIVICILFFVVAPPAFLRSTVITIGKPFWFVSSYVGSAFSGTVSLFQSNRRLIDENMRLKGQVAELTAKNKTTIALQASNQTLTDLFRKKTTREQILAGVLQGPPLSPYDTFLIDAGTADGVLLHDPVVAYGDVAVGTISHAGQHTSEVVMYSSPNVETPAMLLAATSSISVTLTGQGGGNFMVKLPRGVMVATDSPIVLPGTETILVASVGYVIEKPTDAFETVLAVSPFTLQGLRFVQVLSVPHE